ncbi:helix-turn-helix transcriptional regulator [Streptomyces brevispora]|uniref:helix-turn-helix domain-containing protein n=1 Tax=Streptomyces brevispora TaxID=887462 RepID=UPI0033C75A33
MRTHPTGRQLRIGNELRKLREQAGLTATQAGKLLGVKQNQISNMEAGRVGVSPQRASTLAGHYGCGDRELVSGLCDLTSQRGRGWWEEYREVLPGPLLDLAEVEHHARRLRAAVTVHIPGLLQTPEYAREVFRQDVPELSPPDIEHRVSFRIKRQTVLFRDTPTPHHAVVHEAALRMQFGGADVTRRQLRHLLDTSEREHIGISVIPFAAGTFAGSGQSIYYFTGAVPQLDTVNLDQSHGPVFLDSEAQLEKYRVLLGRMESTALGETESRALIHDIVHSL